MSELGEGGTRIEPKKEYRRRVIKETRIEEFLNKLIFSRSPPRHIVSAAQAILLPIIAENIFIISPEVSLVLFNTYMGSLGDAESKETLRELPDDLSKMIHVLKWFTSEFMESVRTNGFESSKSLAPVFYKAFFDAMLEVPVGVIGLVNGVVFEIDEHDSITDARSRDEKRW
jgi:hypothetical protein